MIPRIYENKITRHEYCNGSPQVKPKVFLRYISLIKVLLICPWLVRRRRKIDILPRDSTTLPDINPFTVPIVCGVCLPLHGQPLLQYDSIIHKTRPVLLPFQRSDPGFCVPLRCYAFVPNNPVIKPTVLSEHNHSRNRPCLYFPFLFIINTFFSFYHDFFLTVWMITNTTSTTTTTNAYYYFYYCH